MSTTDDDLDPAIYSPQSAWVPDPTREGGGSWRRETWREVAEQLAAQIVEQQRWVILVADLDRNVNGRHEGDADVGDPTGVSQGNPLLPTGTVLGYSLGGSWQYVMPPRGERHKVDAWRRQRPEDDPR